MEYIHHLIEFLVETVAGWGYLGIFILMALESTVVPIPSELVLIPAGYLAHEGRMSFTLLLFASVAGSLTGALFNYWVALMVGRPFLERYGRYFFVRPSLLQKTDVFFEKYGNISTFTGRLILGVRHLISIPAGLARMPLVPFCVYTCLGAAVWSLVLICFGYFIGANPELIKANAHWLSLAALGLVVIVLVVYFWHKRRQEKLATK